jgi:hypothetical protein
MKTVFATIRDGVCALAVVAMAYGACVLAGAVA